MDTITAIPARSVLPLLWRKHLMLNTRGIILYAAMILVYLGWWAHASDRPVPYLVMGSFMVALLPVTILAREHKDGGIRLSCSLPVTRRTIVIANLSLALLLSVAGGICMFGLPLIPGVGTLAAGQVLSGWNVLLVLSVLTIVSLFIYPSLTRFGPLGLMVGLAGMQIIGTVVLVLTASGVIKGGIRGLVGWIWGTVEGVKGALGSLGFVAVVLVVLALVNGLTYALSLHLFQRLEA
ncbi:MAG: ABC-2 transporter permease [Candidatus Eisenbacteria bacterium]|nr:ABC-2 transporter permease [Candidatus Eisenbacteria bacterium]